MKELIDLEGIKADRATIRKCLQEVVKRTVGQARFDQVYETLWQKREIKPDLQELIRQMDADFAIHPDHVQPIRKIQNDLKSQKKEYPWIRAEIEGNSPNPFQQIDLTIEFVKKAGENQLEISIILYLRRLKCVDCVFD